MLGEKPRTTLWEEEKPSALVSDPVVSRMLQSLAGLLRGAVDAEDSEEWIEVRIEGEAGRGVISVHGGIGGIASVIDDGNGHGSSSCSCIRETIFSRSIDVMCFSFPRLTHCIEFASSFEVGAMATSLRWDCRKSPTRSEVSETAESTLADRSGTSDLAGLGLATSIAGVVAS